MVLFVALTTWRLSGTQANVLKQLTKEKFEMPETWQNPARRVRLKRWL